MFLHDFLKKCNPTELFAGPRGEGELFWAGWDGLAGLYMYLYIYAYTYIYIHVLYMCIYIHMGVAQQSH